MQEWSDLDPRELPDPALLAGHALPSLASPDIINPVVGDLANSVGKGEQQRSHNNNNNTFVSAYRRVFDAHRGVFGSSAAVCGSGSGDSPNNSPRFEQRQLPVQARDMYIKNKQQSDHDLRVGGGGQVKTDTPVRPLRHPTMGSPKTAAPALGVNNKPLKVLAVGGQSASTQSSSVAPTKPSISVTEAKSKGSPIILSRQVADKLREAPKKVSLDLRPEAKVLEKPKQQQGGRPAGELLRTPTGLPDLIPDQRTTAVVLAAAGEPNTADLTNRSKAAAETAILREDKMRPTDVVLRTPYLVEPATKVNPTVVVTAAAVRTLTAEVQAPPRFPQIANNSVVAKGRRIKDGHITWQKNIGIENVRLEVFVP